MAAGGWGMDSENEGERSLFSSALLLLLLFEYCSELCCSGLSAAAAERGIVPLANTYPLLLKQISWALRTC